MVSSSVVVISILAPLAFAYLFVFNLLPSMQDVRTVHLKFIIAFNHSEGIVHGIRDLALGDEDPIIVTRKILVWTPSMSVRGKDKGLVDTVTRLAERCPVKCVVYERGNLDDQYADAVMFHVRTTKYEDLPISRSPNQIYAALCIERPGHCSDIQTKLPKPYFNVSFGYLRNSRNYPFVYGEISRPDRGETPMGMNDSEWKTFYAKKKHLAFVMISHCETDSKRENYLEALSQYANLTLIGGCYQRKCREKECEKELADSHFFYFAFENTVCDDYVTEKFFARTRDKLVPVVLRRRILSGIAPDTAFVAADDFTSPALLAEHLKTVAANETLFRSYFKWRDHFILRAHESEVSLRSNGVCELCKDLHLQEFSNKLNFDITMAGPTDFCESNAALNLL